MQLIRNFFLRHIAGLLATLVVVLAAYLSLSYLGQSIFNDDAHFWYERSTSFIDAVQDNDWEATYQNSKPGVTVMWLSGGSLEAFMQLYFAKNGFRPLLYTQDTFHLVHFAVKAPLVFLWLFFLGFYYFLLRFLFNRWVALLSLTLLAFEPYYLGVHRWFHVEGLLAVFMPLSALLLIAYLQKRKRIVLILSAACAGLALLTKTQGVFMLLYAGLVLGSTWVLDRGSSSFSKDVKRFSLSFFRSYGMWFAVAFIVFFGLFPAMWVEPIRTVEKMVSDTLYTGTIGRNNLEGPLFYVLALSWRLTPLLLTLSILGLVLVVCLRRSFSRLQKVQWFLIVSYFIFYLVMMSLAKQKIDRYLLAVWPFVALFGGWGLYTLKKRFGPMVSVPLTAWLLLLVTFGTTLQHQPYFSTYYSPLLGGRDGAETILKQESIGEVFPEVGNYINEQEGSTELVTVTTMLSQSLRPFTKGKVYHKDETLPEGVTLDYVVVPWYQDLPPQYSSCTHEHSIEFEDDLYWKLYRCPLNFR